MRILRAATLLLLLLTGPGLLQAEAPTFRDLMDPNWMPEPQRGMRVESATIKDGGLHISTTGAELVSESNQGVMVFRQRIGHAREVARVEIEAGRTSAPEITHTGPGRAMVKFGSPGIDLRANGDSLFMLRVREPLRLTVRRSILPGFHASWKSSHLVLDEWGGFGVYCSETELNDEFDPYEPVTARYALPAGAVLWIAVCPPKAYDWQRSLSDHVVWHWSNKEGYPPDSTLEQWAKYGNIVLLQSEIMLWKDWNLAFEPRRGAAEFARVRETVHRLGMKFIVYTSPAYFLRSTPLEKAAFNSFDHFTNWPPATTSGENMELFLDEIGKVMRVHRPDGLYFDGQYSENPAALYALARRSRALLGEDGILEWHSTNALGSDLCFLPQADAYVDFILRGEGRDSLYNDPRYLRFFVSGYNVSNSIGVLCNNGPAPDANLIRRLIAVNGRMHTIASWLQDPKLVELLKAQYRPQMNESLRAEVDRGCDERQAGLPTEVQAAIAERQALLSPPSWDKPVFTADFGRLESWNREASPLNKDPFGTEDGNLAVTGHASTYAYLTKKLDQPFHGMTFKVRRGTDEGMAWGLGVGVRWANGTFLRVGVRSDNLIQANIAGDQRLIPGVDPAKWLWLRVRLSGRVGVIERSDDGKNFSRVCWFEHGGQMNAKPEGILVGKVPYHGRPEDYTEPGPVGSGLIGNLKAY